MPRPVAPRQRGGMTRSRSPLVTLGVLAALGAALLAVDLATESDPSGVTLATTAVDPPLTIGEPVGREDAASTPPPAPPADESPFPSRSQYAGTDRAGALGVAVRFRDERAAAYLCDGAGVEVWLRGRVDGPRLLLSAPDGPEGPDGPALEASLDGRRLTGRVRVAGEWRRFAATPDVPRPLDAAGRIALGGRS
jgi:hypothetical protein